MSENQMALKDMVFFSKKANFQYEIRLIDIFWKIIETRAIFNIFWQQS